MSTFVVFDLAVRQVDMLVIVLQRAAVYEDS